MIRIFFGNIGCGKTTLAARMFYKHLRSDARHQRRLFRRRKQPAAEQSKCRYDYYFSNFPCSLSTETSLSDLGEWTFPPYSYIVIDEAGIEYNNRKYKTMKQSLIEWLKLSRHYRCDVDFLSQSWDDIDITVRRLASELWYVRRIGPFTMLRRIYKRVGIDETTHQIVDFFSFNKIWQIILYGRFNDIQIFLRKPYYKYFDSFSTPNTPIKSEFKTIRKVFPPSFFQQLLSGMRTSAARLWSVTITLPAKSKAAFSSFKLRFLLVKTFLPLITKKIYLFFKSRFPKT